jgi:SAM-dependent methyltransferase
VTSAYDVSGFREPEAEIARLERQATVIAVVEEDALDALGLPQTGQVLDVGCGPGFVATRIGKARPALGIIGIDRDPTVLERARSRIKVIEGDATCLPFRDSQFDGVYVRLLLRHLANPTRALTEIHRVLRPGGRVVVIDSDDGALILHPPLPAFARALVAREETFHRRSADPLIARRLLSLLIQAGFVDIALRSLILDSLTLGRPSFARIVLDPLADAIDEDVLPSAAVDAARGAIHAWEANEDAFGLTVALALGGTKR